MPPASWVAPAQAYALSTMLASLLVVVMLVLSGRFISFFKNQLVESLSFLLSRNLSFSLYCLLPITSTLWSLVPEITLKATLAH